MRSWCRVWQDVVHRYEAHEGGREGEREREKERETETERGERGESE